ncbi:hypothetical protein PBCV1_a126R [Paramecium bursaria Chlorella virus 1]|uniref:Uncharacterized protein n=1 Tax=Paramecium bursaria Chlorella virus 1 TaxID=10506 RepID=Q84446_PBCV1|nr:hypothetical protein PBCV1_a126R [Paramecium bursaria Chlorella virus 1]AAC96494.1 hypothetical protein [Paramecium bursaria Chlorella virus 1]
MMFRFVGTPSLHFIVARFTRFAFTALKHSVRHIFRIHCRCIRKPQCLLCGIFKCLFPFFGTYFPRF